MRARAGRAWLPGVLLALWLVAGCSTEAVAPAIVMGDGGGMPAAADMVGGGDLPGGPEVVGTQCAVDDDCGALYCFTPNHECVECLISSHCAAGEKCVDHACVPQPGSCTSDAQCTAKGLVCDPEKGQCVECLDASHCGGGEYCLDGKCLDWVCTPEATWCNGSVAFECNADGSAVAAETDCNDGDACTVGDACVNGSCKETKPADCDDDNVCTSDACDPADGCYHQFIEGPCDDGTQCTQDDHCQEGVCVAGELVCECVVDADCAAEEDGDLCNGTLVCQDGYCLIAPDSVVTCEQPADPCITIGCVPDTGACEETGAADGQECDDESECTQNDVCADGVCTGEEVPCDDGNVCTADSCDPELGCIHEPAAGACDDGNKCTTDDACQDGLCVGAPLDCEDGNPCTAHSCLPAKGCQSQELEGPCEDGDACTVNDTCVEAVCKGEPLACEDDGNYCTNDLCDPVEGCVHPFNDLPCDDGNPCTTDDHCQMGECVPGDLLYDCDDDNPCTTDSCNAETGECLHTPNAQPCDDGDACTDGDQCSQGNCIPGTPKDCDDSNPCTTDACNSKGECTHTPADGSCEDGNACTTGDKCVGGVCQPGSGLKCNDQNACTDDSCDPVEGCVYVNNDAPCTDNDECTLGDACVEGSCQSQSVLDCDDSNGCTNDSCDPLAGCLNVPNNLACDDGDACTEGDYCAAGVCLSGGPVTCEDENPCTDDYCLVDSGCVFDPNTAPCEDGDPCTFDDQCGDGACQSGELTDCDDGNPCTEDVCDFDTCQHPFADGACDDGDPCSVGDACDNGFCSGTVVANCGCYSLALDGQTGYGRVDAGGSLTPKGDFTVELWFKQAGTGEAGLVTQWDGSAGSAFALGLTANGQARFRLWAPSDNDVQPVVTAPVPQDGAWHHLAAVRQGDVLSLYVDGSKKTAVAPVGKMPASSLPLLIGVRNPQALDGKYLAGQVDEIRLSDAALYTESSFEPAGALAVQDSTLAYWSADQDQFDVLFDTGPAAQHARLYGTTSWSTDTAGEVCVPVPNFPPSSPVVAIGPPSPTASQDLVCTIEEEAVDLENDPVEYTWQWFKDGKLQEGYTTDTLPASATSDCPTWQCDKCQTWTCRAVASDGTPGLPGEASTTVGKATCKECDGTLFQNHCYKLVNNGYEWGGANKQCQNWGGYLVTITSNGENALVDSLCPGICWIGLSDQADEGEWAWVTGEPVTTEKWRWGQPNNGGWFGNQDCVAMCQDCGWNQDSGLWQDEECNSNRAFVCEMAP